MKKLVCCTVLFFNIFYVTAQDNFEGIIEYKGKDKSKGSTRIVAKMKYPFVRLTTTFLGKARLKKGNYDSDLVFDFEKGKLYEIEHFTKEIFETDFKSLYRIHGSLKKDSLQQKNFQENIKATAYYEQTKSPTKFWYADNYYF